MIAACTKTCTKCGEIKPVDEFWANPRSPDGRRARCKTCLKAVNAAYKLANPELIREHSRARVPIRRESGENRASHLKRKFGLTPDAYAEMSALQGGVCVICRQPETKVCRTGVVQPLSVDHDHATGRVRGLLCCNCNRMLGSAQDSVEVLQAAANYLSTHAPA